MQPLKLIISGMIAANPWQGGATWAVLQYVLGLRRLGHEVLFVEELATDALQPAGTSLAASESAAYFRHVVDQFDLASSAALVAADGGDTFNLTRQELRRFASNADLLLNISGALKLPELIEPIPRRVYLDLDPGFTQIWHEAEGIDMGFDRHTHFATIGMTLDRPGCEATTCGKSWITTPQPIVLDQWPASATPHNGVFTTLGHWRSYGSCEYRGRFYGQKAHSLRQFIDLPARVQSPILLAMSIHPDEKRDLAALATHGWQRVEPSEVAATPESYRRFVARSMAEFGIAKSGYVAANCGWFSDRSVCYLASGRPVLAQDTGFAAWLPTGAGLLTFKGYEDAEAAFAEICGAYTKHRTAARDLAATYFDSDRVLERLLERLAS